jgi:hypothetical protein
LQEFGATVGSCVLSYQYRAGKADIVYSVYGDESRDEEQKRVYAVAAVFGTNDDWSELEAPWNTVLGGRVFHAAECEFGQGDLKDLKKGDGKRIYKGLVTLIVRRRFFGLGIAINVADYHASFRTDFADAPYLWAFGDCVRAAAEMAHLTIPSGQVQVTFDRNEPIRHNAETLYAFIRRFNDTKHRELLCDELSFASRRTVGIQVADLFARETMKHMDDRITRSDRQVRLSFTALRQTGRFDYKTLESSDFEQRKQVLIDQLGSGAEMSTYWQWIHERRLQDCNSNRIAHLEHVRKLHDN